MSRAVALNICLNDGIYLQVDVSSSYMQMRSTPYLITIISQYSSIHVFFHHHDIPSGRPGGILQAVIILNSKRYSGKSATTTTQIWSLETLNGGHSTRLARCLAHF